MNKKQLLKSLHILNRQLVTASSRMYKISQKLGIEENQDIKRLIADVEELIRIGEGK